MPVFGGQSRWFNVRTWGSWRLAFLLAKLQRALWERHEARKEEPAVAEAAAPAAAPPAAPAAAPPVAPPVAAAVAEVPRSAPSKRPLEEVRAPAAKALRRATTAVPPAAPRPRGWQQHLEKSGGCLPQLSPSFVDVLRNRQGPSSELHPGHGHGPRPGH